MWQQMVNELSLPDITRLKILDSLVRVEGLLGGGSSPTALATEVTLSALNSKFNTLGQKSMANSVPIVISSDQSAIPVNVNNLSGIATEVTLASINSKIPILTVSGLRLLVDGSGVVQPISGTVTANTGLNPLTDVQLRATPVSTTFTNTSIQVSNTVNVNTGLLQSLTDAQLRASPVEIKLNDYKTDASGRVRTSSTTNLGDYKILNSTFDTNVLESAGTGSITPNSNSITMTVAAGQYIIIQSRQFHPYINGKSQLVQMTVAGFGSAANVEKSIGYYSSSGSPYNSNLDGFRLFKDTSNNYSIQIWRNGTQLTTSSLNRANWIDKLDGTGASGIVVNFDNFNVFAFDFLYLGGTTLRCFIHLNGENILFAKYHYSNTDTDPFMLSPNKPIRYEIRSTTGTSTMKFICAAVSTEGDLNQIGLNRSVNGVIGGLNPLLAGIKYAICGIRKLPTFRDIFTFVDSFEGIISTDDFINWEIMKLTPANIAGVVSWDGGTSGTPFESFQGAITNIVTGGTVLSNTWSSLNMNNARRTENILARLGGSIQNTSTTMDIIALCATPALLSSNVRVTGSMQVTWLY